MTPLLIGALVALCVHGVRVLRARSLARADGAGETVNGDPPSLHRSAPLPSIPVDTTGGRVPFNRDGQSSARALPPSRYRQRPSGEWQGMLVDEALQALCDTTARCSMALACINEHCGGCRNDDDCLNGETCVLDHCLLRRRVSCRTRKDCGADAMCILSDYGTDTRGNEGMIAYCNPNAGGREQDSNSATAVDRQRTYGPRLPGRVDVAGLLRSLEE